MEEAEFQLQLDRIARTRHPGSKSAIHGAADTHRYNISQRSRRIARSLLSAVERTVRFIVTRIAYALLLCSTSNPRTATTGKHCKALLANVLMHLRNNRWTIVLFVSGVYIGGLLIEETERPCSHSGDVSLLSGALDLKRRFLVDTSGDELLQPRIVAMPDVEQDNPAPKVKYTRPEFLRTELGLREKVLVSILTSRETAPKLALPLSKTISSHSLPTMVFAKSSDYDAVPAELEAIQIDLAEQSAWQFPLKVMSYVQSQHGKKYDFHYFIPDTIYVEGTAFNEFISRIAVTTAEQYAGVPDGVNHYCDFDAGIVISKAVLDGVAANLATCSELATASFTKTIGLCIARSIGVKCSATADGFPYSVFSLQMPAASMSPEVLRNAVGLNHSIAIYPVLTPEALYRLHEHFCRMEIDTMKDGIKEAEIEAWRTKLLPLGDPAASIVWPIGTHEQTRPEKRFDIKRWDYFDMTGIYYDNEFINVRPLTGPDRIDINEVISRATEVIEIKYPDKYSFLQLTNGYRKLDPNRGMMYIVDIELREKKGYKKVLKRIELIRPISSLEIISLPPGAVSKVALYIVLPMTSHTKVESLRDYLRKYDKEIVQGNYEAELVAAFVYDEREYPQLAKKVDACHSLKEELKSLKDSTGITTLEIKQSQPSQMKLFEAVSQKLSSAGVIIISSVEMDVSVELLDRARTNTVKGTQVYSPIGFWQYLPELVYNMSSPTVELEVNRDFGRFETSSYEHISFYISDFLESAIPVGASSTDVYDAFLSSKRLHIMRAVEPALKIRHREVSCSDSTANESKQCRKFRQSNLASKAKLALVYFKDHGLL